MVDVQPGSITMGNYHYCSNRFLFPPALAHVHLPVKSCSKLAHFPACRTQWIWQDFVTYTGIFPVALAIPPYLVSHHSLNEELPPQPMFRKHHSVWKSPYPPLQSPHPPNIARQMIPLIKPIPASFYSTLLAMESYDILL